MDDFRLVAARRLLWDKERCRSEPAFRALVISTMQGIAASDNESPEARAEAETLIEKLYLAGNP